MEHSDEEKTGDIAFEFDQALVQRVFEELDAVKSFEVSLLERTCVAFLNRFSETRKNASVNFYVFTFLLERNVIDFETYCQQYLL